MRCFEGLLVWSGRGGSGGGMQLLQIVSHLMMFTVIEFGGSKKII